MLENIKNSLDKESNKCGRLLMNERTENIMKNNQGKMKKWIRHIMRNNEWIRTK